MIFYMSKLRIKPEQIIPISFLLVILTGALLLMLPASSASGDKTDFLTALFTATTSVCVTGLVVVDTYAHWSLFGQFIIMLLIQIGGLGIVAVASMIMLLTRRKFLLHLRMLLGDSLNLDPKREALFFLKQMFIGVFIVEAVGALLCAVSFVPLFGPARGLWASVFQSVSAFCNAGMDVVGPNSMIDLRTSNLLMYTTMILIVLGGVGFVVWFDLASAIRYGIKHRFSPLKVLSRLPEHTKIALIMTLSLILFGTVCILAAEYNNPGTLGGMKLYDKVLNSLFQSVTLRTAGYASLPQENLTEISCMIGYILMFIGGSPIGTAGGIKTVTAFLFFMNAYSYINGRNENVVFHKRVPEDQMRKASAIVFFSLITILVMTLLLMSRGGIRLTDALYEVISALGTVGVSRDLTPKLDSIGRIIIIISMYLGRIGPISMILFFTRGSGPENTLKHADGKFYVG